MTGNGKRMNVPVGKSMQVVVKSAVLGDAFQFNFEFFSSMDSFEQIERESIDVSVDNGKLVVTLFGRRIVPKGSELTLPVGVDLRSLSARYVKNTGRLVVIGKLIKEFDVVVQ